MIGWKKSCEATPSVFSRYFRYLQFIFAYFDALLAEAKAALSAVKDAEFEKDWSMTHGEEVLFTLPKKQIARLFCMNHLVHLSAKTTRLWVITSRSKTEKAP